MRLSAPFALALGIALVGCGPRIQPLRPIMDNGATLPPTAEQTVAQARTEGELEQARIAAESDATFSAALADCRPTMCEAIARGEVALGMTQAQMLAATRTTPAAWDVRGGGAGAVLVAREPLHPRDATGELALVRFTDGEVQSYTYREPHGLRTISEPADETFAGRAAAQAEALLEEGDMFVLRGALDLALDRYDRADILAPGNPETNLRIARVLDKQLRPIEAILRYRLFIHQLELERIAARGDAAAKLADAIARARERIIVLERQ